MYSKYARDIFGQQDTFDFVAAHFACEQDKFSNDNPDGFVNFGSAQNFLGKLEIAERLKSLKWQEQDTPYRKFIGTDDCRLSVASYLQEISGREVSFDHLVIGNGLISLMEALGHSILDRGDSVLIPTPVFPGLVTALTARTGASFVALEAEADSGFQLTPAALREKLDSLSLQGDMVIAVLLCWPGNPVGQVFSAQEVKEFVCLAEEFGIALIVDEIYASSCFEGVEFVSALSFESDNVFVVGGLSKDFGVAGLTTAWVHTTNDVILAALKKQSHFFRLAAPIQRAMQSFLAPDWRRDFLQQHRTRLTENHDYAFEEIISMGVSVAPAQAGLVLWLDLRESLKSQDEAGQLELYRYLLEQHRVHLSPASGFHFSQPGFFRICFSHQRETLQEGLGRIQQGLHQLTTKRSNQFSEV